LNPIVAYICRNIFEKVIGKTDEQMKDFWFVWHDDYEPIRIAYTNGKITKASHRFHWMHKDVDDPYSNDIGRIEALFIPISHTPVIRKEKMDLNFYILTNSFTTQRIETYDVSEADIPEYYTCVGKKNRHFPPVEYEGWPDLI